MAANANAEQPKQLDGPTASKQPEQPKPGPEATKLSQQLDIIGDRDSIDPDHRLTIIRDSAKPGDNKVLEDKVYEGVYIPKNSTDLVNAKTLDTNQLVDTFNGKRDAANDPWQDEGPQGKFPKPEQPLLDGPGAKAVAKPAPEQPSQELATSQPQTETAAGTAVATATETVDPNSPEAKLAQAKIDLDAARTKYVNAGHGFAGKIAKMFGSEATMKATENYNKALKSFQEASFVKLEADISDPAMNEKITETGKSRAETLAEATMRGLSIGEFVALQDEELKVKEQKLANSKFPGYKNIVDKYSKARKFVTETISNKLFGTDKDTTWGKKAAAAAAVGLSINLLTGAMTGGALPAAMRLAGAAAAAENYRSGAEGLAKQWQLKRGEKDVQAGLEKAIKSDGTVDLSIARNWVDNKTNNMDSKFQNMRWARVGRGLTMYAAAAGITEGMKTLSENTRDSWKGMDAEASPLLPDNQDVLKPHFENHKITSGETLTGILKKDLLAVDGGEGLKPKQLDNVVENLLHPEKSFDHDTAQRVREVLANAGITDPDKIQAGREVPIQAIYDAIGQDKLKLLHDHAQGLNADKIAENIKADNDAAPQTAEQPQHQAAETTGHDSQDHGLQNRNAEYFGEIHEKLAEDKYHTAENAQRKLGPLTEALRNLLGNDYANSPQYDKLKDIPVQDILSGNFPFHLVDSMPGDTGEDVHKLQGILHKMIDAQSLVIAESRITAPGVQFGDVLVANADIIRDGPLEMDALGNITEPQSPRGEQPAGAGNEPPPRQEASTARQQVDASKPDDAPQQTRDGSPPNRTTSNPDHVPQSNRDGSPPSRTSPGETNRGGSAADSTRQPDTAGLTPEEEKTRQEMNQETLDHVKTLHKQELHAREALQRQQLNQVLKANRENVYAQEQAIRNQAYAEKKVIWAEQQRAREWDRDIGGFKRDALNEGRISWRDLLRGNRR